MSKDLIYRLRDLERRYPNETVAADYHGTGTWIGEPAAEVPLWPTCDEVLANWYGIDPADVAEFMTEVNWRTNEREEN